MFFRKNNEYKQWKIKKKKKTAPHVILNIICYYINAIAYISVHLSNNQTVSNANNDTENEPSVYLCIYLYPHRAIEYNPI